MKPLPQTADVLHVASRVMWFEPATSAIADPVRFLTYVMTFGAPQDLAVLSGIVGLDDYRDALDRAPPGIFDARSWAYWNLRCGRYPTPPMPRRFA